MWKKNDFLKSEEIPNIRARVAGERVTVQATAKEVKAAPRPKADEKAVLEAVIRGVLKEASIPEMPSGCDKLPYEEARKLAALQAIETYLSAQLLQVRKEIEKIKNTEMYKGVRNDYLL